MAPAGVLEALGHALAGATGTALSTAAVYPLDLVTTRLKVQRQLRREDAISEKDQYRGVFHALKAISSQEGGVSALYTGLAQDVFKSIADSFLFFLFYQYFRDARRRSRGRRRLPVIDELAVGALAGACARGCTTPIANVVARKQTSAMFEGNADGENASVWKILSSIGAENGIAGLWAGYSASLLLTINPSITFFLNEQLGKTLLPDSDETSHNTQTTFLLAAASKSIATIISYPLQTAKARLQMRGSGNTSPRRSTDTLERPSGSESNKEPQSPTSVDERSGALNKLKRMAEGSVIAIVLSIARTEGLSALYAGLQGEVLKSFFNHGLTMVTKGIIHKFVIRLGILLLSLSQGKSRRVRLQRLRQIFLRLR
ncbi:peroxisomal adenine nucleotide carrier 1 [Colletotrichum spaethianum]|uniref:Peroxisomal adenine nucleotide carrier 1 n=1 Tax=Colletotrichum spaethianum TaxID=700344 RepID=A0AA37LAJ1_9PEZI|nr:peroxisomal adenine nucleotide carrier 1 [Colletotrichum spaethianum]GKT43749.1 peroxisomal adenine nucleotide carrier 1 [Colletotrichum spaethianum]